MISTSPVLYKMTSNHHKNQSFQSPDIQKNKGFYLILQDLDEKCISYSKRSKKIIEEHSVKKGSIMKTNDTQNFKERISQLEKEFSIVEERTKKAFELIYHLKEKNII